MWKIRCYVILSVLFCGALSNKTGFNAFKFQQHFNRITADRFELARWNKNIFNYASVGTFKYNRTCTAMNMTWLANIELGYDVEMIVQFKKFMSNEYRHFPLRFQINACDAVKENAFGVADFSKHENFRGCPIKKGVHYGIWSWVLDGSKFPPLIPEGNYKMEFQGICRGMDLGLFNLYLSIQPPPPKH